MNMNLGDIVHGLPHSGMGVGVIQEGLTVVDGEVTATPGSMTTTGGILPMMPEVPRFMSAEMPTATGTARALIASARGKAYGLHRRGVGDVTTESPITPQDLNQRLPSIVDNTPMVMPASIDGVSQWVIANPLMAGALLLGAAFLVFMPKGREK